MNVLIISTCLDTGYGAESVLRHLMGGWDSNNIHLHFLAPSTSSIFMVAQNMGFPTYELPIGDNRLNSHLKATWRALKKIPADKVDIVHAWTAREFELTLLFPSKIRKSGTLHDHPEACFHSVPRRWIMRQASNRFNSLACVSSAVLLACQESRYHAPLKVVHNGLIDFERPHQPLPNKRTIRIGFLGMYADWKGFDLILTWIRELSEMPIVWNLYGNPTLRNQGLLADVDQKINIKGWTEPDEIWSEIDILVHSSTRFDPLPTVLIEAARSGIPCVASSEGGSGEIVLEKETGFLFQTDNPEKGLFHLRTLIEHPEKIRSIGQAARRRYEANFKIPKMVGAYSDFWENL